MRGGCSKDGLDGKWVAAIKSCLHTRYGVVPKHQGQFWKDLPEKFNAYKQATITNGDRVRAAHYQGIVDEGDPDRRDATFVRVSGHRILQCPHHSFPIALQYSLVRDIHEKKPNVPPVFKGTEYFGQLISIMVIDLAPGIVPSITRSETHVLAIIGIRDTETETRLGIPYYTEPKEAKVRAVDMNTLMCLVGRVRDGRRWAIVDRSGDMARAEFVD